MAGLDLGKASDPSALVVAERRWRHHPAGPERCEAHYTVRLIRRWPLGTLYSEVLGALARQLAAEPLAGERPLLAVDATGVGAAVLEMMQALRLPCVLRPVLITAGHAEGLSPDGSAHVPRTGLVGLLKRLFQTDRLKVGPVPGRDLLYRELRNFVVRVSNAGNELFEAFKAGQHDDMVLAAAIMCWCGENWAGTFYPSSGVPDKPSREALRERFLSGDSDARRQRLFGLRRGPR